MEIEWDEEKDRQNRAKHGVGLGDAALMDWGHANFEVDDRFDYGEERVVAYGLIDDRLHVCVFVDRHGVRRIISLRKANKREILHYVVRKSAPIDEQGR
jgi:uncharacterized protein